MKIHTVLNGQQFVPGESVFQWRIEGGFAVGQDLLRHVEIRHKQPGLDAAVTDIDSQP